MIGIIKQVKENAIMRLIKLPAWFYVLHRDLLAMNFHAFRKDDL